MSTSYLLTAAGVIFLSVAVGIIAPEGRLKKSINFVLRLICICVMVQPVANIFSDSGDTSSDVSECDYSYVCRIYSDSQSRVLSDMVCDAFGDGYVCTVEIVVDGGNIKENGVSVEGDFKNGVTIEKMTEYLRGLGYINITVNEKGD